MEPFGGFLLLFGPWGLVWSLVLAFGVQYILCGHAVNNSINKAPLSGEKMENIPLNTFKVFVKLRRSRKSGFHRQSGLGFT